MSNEYNSNRQSESAWGPMPDPDPIYQGQPPYPQQPPYGQYGSGYGYQNPNPYGQYGYGGPPPPVAYLQKASLGQRIISWLIDGLITSAMVMIPVFFFLFVGLIFIDTDGYGSRAATGIGVLFIIFGYLIAFGLSLAYYAISISKGQTVGNRVAGMRFVDVNGAPPGIGKAFLRLLVMGFVSGWFLIGYLWMLWDPEQQTLHDKIAGTYGVTNNRY